MILLWGPEADGPLAAVRAALARAGAAAFLLDQGRARDIEIDAELGARVEGTLRLGGTRYDLASVSAVYLRCHETRAIAPGAEADAALIR